jgi:hypothetical protein
MAQDVIGREITVGSAVFYNGFLYKVTKTKGHMVGMNYLRGRLAAHARERELIREYAPALNTR